MKMRKPLLKIDEVLLLVDTYFQMADIETKEFKKTI